MKLIAILLCALFNSTVSAGNFIDNPNFDSGAKDWVAMSSLPFRFYYHDSEGAYDLDNFVTKYDESARDLVIIDHYISARITALQMIWVILKNVPAGIPLYFYVEASFENSSSIEIIINLSEDNETLILKKVRLTNSDVWSVIASDYPVYKKKQETPLTLYITFPYPITDPPKTKFQLNYVQVGTDLAKLGGRGARLKQ
jgi:hypothetical protein